MVGRLVIEPIIDGKVISKEIISDDMPESLLEFKVDPTFRQDLPEEATVDFITDAIAMEKNENDSDSDWMDSAVAKGPEGGPLSAKRRPRTRGSVANSGNIKPPQDRKWVELTSSQLKGGSKRPIRGPSLGRDESPGSTDSITGNRNTANPLRQNCDKDSPQARYVTPQPSRSQAPSIANGSSQIDEGEQSRGASHSPSSGPVSSSAFHASKGNQLSRNGTLSGNRTLDSPSSRSSKRSATHNSPNESDSELEVESPDSQKRLPATTPGPKPQGSPGLKEPSTSSYSPKRRRLHTDSRTMPAKSQTELEPKSSH